MRLKMLLTMTIALAAPLAFSPNTGVGFNNACAAGGDQDGSCCPKAAICGLNGQNYAGFQYSSGRCP
jgi:hypothetical protein